MKVFTIFLGLIAFSGWASANPILVGEQSVASDSQISAPEFAIEANANRAWVQLLVSYRVSDEYNPRGAWIRYRVAGLSFDSRTQEVIWNGRVCARLQNRRIVNSGACQLSHQITRRDYDNGYEVFPGQVRWLQVFLQAR